MPPYAPKPITPPTTLVGAKITPKKNPEITPPTTLVGAKYGSGSSGSIPAPYANTPIGQAAYENKKAMETSKPNIIASQSSLVKQSQTINVGGQTINSFFKESNAAQERTNPFQTGFGPLDTLTKSFVVGGSAAGGAITEFGGSMAEKGYLQNAALKQKYSADGTPLDYFGRPTKLDAKKEASPVRILFKSLLGSPSKPGKTLEAEKTSSKNSRVAGEVTINAVPYVLAPEISIPKQFIDISQASSGQKVGESLLFGGAVGGGTTLVGMGANLIPGTPGVVVRGAAKYGSGAIFGGMTALSFSEQAPTIFGSNRAAGTTARKDLFASLGANFLGGRAASGAITKTSNELKFIGTPFIESTKIVSPEVLTAQKSGVQLYPQAKPYNRGAPKRLVTEFNAGKYAKPLGLEKAGFHVTTANLAKNLEIARGTSRTPGGYVAPNPSLEFGRLRGNSGRSVSLFGELAPGSPKIAVFENMEAGRIPTNLRPAWNSGSKGVNKGNEFFEGRTGTPGKGYISSEFEAGMKGEKEAIILQTSQFSRKQGAGLFGKLTGYSEFTKIESKGPLGLSYKTKVGIQRFENLNSFGKIIPSVTKSQKSVKTELPRERNLNSSSRVSSSFIAPSYSGESSSSISRSISSSIGSLVSFGSRGSYSKGSDRGLSDLLISRGRGGGSSGGGGGGSDDGGGSSNRRSGSELFREPPPTYREGRSENRYSSVPFIPSLMGSTTGGQNNNKKESRERRKFYDELTSSFSRIGLSAKKTVTKRGFNLWA